MNTPPVLHASDSALTAALVVLIFVALVLAAHCLRDTWRGRTLVPVFVLLGGVPTEVQTAR
jgi:hypothetical protein